MVSHLGGDEEEKEEEGIRAAAAKGGTADGSGEAGSTFVEIGTARRPSRCVDARLSLLRWIRRESFVWPFGELRRSNILGQDRREGTVVRTRSRGVYPEKPICSHNRESVSEHIQPLFQPLLQT